MIREDMVFRELVDVPGKPSEAAFSSGAVSGPVNKLSVTAYQDSILKDTDAAYLRNEYPEKLAPIFLQKTRRRLQVGPGLDGCHLASPTETYLRKYAPWF